MSFKIIILFYCMLHTYDIKYFLSMKQNKISLSIWGAYTDLQIHTKFRIREPPFPFPS